MTRAFDLSVYLVTDPSARFGVVETAAAAVRGGATMVQVRDKYMDDDAFVVLGRAMQEALASSGVPLIVNDRVGLVEAIGAAGVHIGQSDMGVEEARSIIGPDALLGLSIENLEQSVGPFPGVDYLGVGPLRDAPIKPDHAPPIGMNGFADICAGQTLPCVAIGAITAGDAREIKSAGGAGLAVVSAICAADDPEAATRNLVAAWRDA